MKPVITICMGSSCFARGNERNLSVIEDFLAENGLEGEVDLLGSRCEGHCIQGPNVRIDNTLYEGVDAGMLMDLLKQRFHVHAKE